MYVCRHSYNSLMPTIVHAYLIPKAYDPSKLNINFIPLHAWLLPSWGVPTDKALVIGS